MTTQTKLAHLRSQLNLLRQRRLVVRWSQAACHLMTIALLLLIASFLWDWSFNLSLDSRKTVLAICMALGIWVVRRKVWPLISVHESLEEISLIVERENKIDSDLVAALQFDQPQAKSWGSSRLTTAVVDYVSDFSPSLNVFEGFSYQTLPRQGWMLGTILLLVTGSVIAFPQHASAFWNRFLLGTAHYPTRTQIVSLKVGGQEVSVFHTGPLPVIRIPYGVPITINVECRGEIPSAGYASLSGLKNDSENRIDLKLDTGPSASFSGELAHLVESFRIRFHLGDAISDPAEVHIVPLPLVDLAWEIEPPKYAVVRMKTEDTEGGARQFSALEGSKAQLKLQCVNKRLRSARITAGETIYDLIAGKDLVDAEKGQAIASTWALPPDTLFESIREPIKYVIQVIDEDGLSLEAPLHGQIRLRSDRPPRIVASAVTRQVLPSAQPTLDYVAGDDFGISNVVAVVQISREGGSTSRNEIIARNVSEAEQPLTSLRGQVRIPLSTYELTKGDEVNVILQVSDWRGGIPGQQYEAEAVRFSVTDLNGIFAQTGEEDKKTAKQLDEILRRELGISGGKKDEK